MWPRFVISGRSAAKTLVASSTSVSDRSRRASLMVGISFVSSERPGDTRAVEDGVVDATRRDRVADHLQLRPLAFPPPGQRIVRFAPERQPPQVGLADGLAVPERVTR